MTTTPALPLDDVLNTFALAKAVPDPETLEEFTRAYPAYAEALTEFAVALLLDDAIEDEADDDQIAANESVSPAVSRAISFFQNAVYELDSKPPAILRSVAQPKNLFADLDRVQFRSVAKSLHANNTFMIKLRDRTLEPDTVVSRTGFCQKVAEETSEPLNLVLAHFQGEQAIARGQHYKSDNKPALKKRETFEEAVRNSGLTTEQQAYLLGLG
ncbi:hypothetical protein JQ634_22235 [Bradyrhizobium sp. AUGA SZCCT0240]|uniref:hypothetical protein n=1 Tax=Bradyrhizobium sp. AUGA SZCCT0240 TaxID=2807669 RepID=UPI001BA9A749|nr:hypothetical protein [Bradyrhizobium sp. AUGA SZCCT0240]MBR1256412.1 hypothetical protein [Bradyrhizobium sp. AUGA SZCCT0240]